MLLVCLALTSFAALCVNAAHGVWEWTTTIPREVAAGEGEGSGTLRVQLDVFSEKLLLELKSDQAFLAPGFVQRVVGEPDNRGENQGENQMENQGVNQTENQRENRLGLDSSAEASCFYSGTVNGEKSSAAALNVCRGLSGAFYSGTEEFYIQPANTTGGRDSSGWGVHVVKRRNRRDTGSKCGVNEDEEKVPKHPVHHQPEPQGRRRARRFVSTPRYMEIMIVADRSMVDFHGDGLKPYLLTMMAVAARLYRHPTIHNSISLAVVKLMVIHDEDRGPAVSGNAALTLRNFCQWQRQHNPPSDRHPEHYDTAVLLTRKDLCGANSCDTLGMADVGTLCDPERSCSVVEDDGLQAAFTIAHELGHVLNMPHDSARQCTSVNRGIGATHMMASTLSDLNQLRPWSPCSALMVTSFLDDGHGHCLLDRPGEPERLPQTPPGLVYDADYQCRLMFGEESQHCPDLSTTCTMLWCTVTTKNGLLVCQTKSFPWADGTPCGRGSVCVSGQCLSSEDADQYQIPVNGGWGTWGPWGECSRTCGGGVQYSFRDCDDPLPENGGRYCEGKRIQYRSCNTEACLDTNGLTFREEQCLAHNDVSSHVTFGSGEGVEWVPKYAGVSPKDRCKLVCRAKGTGYFFILKPKVADGTLCTPDSTSVCVQGQCVKAGCNRVIGSSVQYDKCGVCGGNGSTCKKFSGSLEYARAGYQDVVTIPAGATHVDVKQRSPGGRRLDNSYLAVVKADGTYVLNGDYKLTTLETDVSVQGAHLHYSGSSASLERLRSFAPLPEPLTVQVLSVGAAPRPRIKYSYFAPRPASDPSGSTRRPVNAIGEAGAGEWTFYEWGPCSATCGEGAQNREVLCQDGQGRPARDCPEELRPPSARACLVHACPAWAVGEWSACSRSCGKGFRRRTLHCAGHDGRALPSESCGSVDRPRPLIDLCLQSTC